MEAKAVVDELCNFSNMVDYACEDVLQATSIHVDLSFIGLIKKTWAEFENGYKESYEFYLAN